MGKQKYQQQIEQLFSKSPVVNFQSIAKIVSSHEQKKQYTKQLVRNLLLKEKIKVLTKGYYTKHNEISFAVFCFQPAYIGLQDALSFHELWEQETIPIIITARKIRTGIRTVQGQNILIHRIDPKYYFGIEHTLQEDAALPYSDLEKTFIDMAYFHQILSREVIAEIKKKIDMKKLKVYLKRYPQMIREQVLHAL